MVRAVECLFVPMAQFKTEWARTPAGVKIIVAKIFILEPEI